MKTKTKMIIALSLAGVITLGAVIALVVVIASFNATAGSGLSVSYVAKNVEAEVSMGYLVSEENSNNPKSLTYTTVQAGSNDKLTFSSSDTAETISKSFDELDEIELTKDGYVYLKYTIKHTGTTANSQNYLNVTLANTFSTLNNIELEYCLYDSELSNYYYESCWMAGVNGLTIIRDGDNECVLFVRMYVDVKTQNALLDGSIKFNMTTSDSDYYANLRGDYLFQYDPATSVIFGSNTAENLANVAGITPTSLSTDGSGPVNKYQLADNTTYILSDSKIYATSCSYMFNYCSSMTSVDFTFLDTSYVKNMDCMFYESNSLVSVDLSTLDTSNVTKMGLLFGYCFDLISIDFGDIDTSNVVDMSSMFQYCEELTTIDLSSLDTLNVINMNRMFSGCSNLTTIYVDDSWSTEMVTGELERKNVFIDCTSLVGGNGTVYNSSHTDATYARIDTAETPGYFTLKTA